MAHHEGSRFIGSRVLITGGAHGIGAACARRLVAEGARVGVTDLDIATAREVVTALGGSHDEHLAVELDVTDDDSVRAGVTTVADQLGGIDVLVNTAGGGAPHRDFEELGDDMWSQVIDFNLMSAVRSIRASLPHLRRSENHPAIVSVSSVNALLALGGEPYSAAKLGLLSLTQNLAAQLGPAGIRVNAVTPGTIRTRVWDNQEGGADRMVPFYPLGRVGEPEDIAAAVAFLASRDASWITGHALPVDGGLLTGHRTV